MATRMSATNSDFGSKTNQTKGRRIEEAPENGEVLTSTRKRISDDSYEYYKNLGVNFDRKNEGQPSSRSSKDWLN